MRVQYPKCVYGPYCLLDPYKNGVYILVEVSFYISIRENQERYDFSLNIQRP